MFGNNSHSLAEIGSKQFACVASRVSFIPFIRTVHAQILRKSQYAQTFQDSRRFKTFQKKKR